MSGFETMRSSVNQFLHPSLNVTDRYDPTFQGVPHKRRIAGYGSAGPGSSIASLNGTANTAVSLRGGMTLNSSSGARAASSLSLSSSAAHAAVNDIWLLHRGKRPDPSGPRHDPAALTHDPAMAQPFNNKGSTDEVRFGKGFVRRAHSAINAEAPRLETEARRSAAAAEREAVVRQRHADRERPLNPLTWSPTATSIAYDTITSRENNYANYNQQAFMDSSFLNNNNNNNANSSSGCWVGGQLNGTTATSNAASKSTPHQEHLNHHRGDHHQHHHHQHQHQQQPPLYPILSLSDKPQSLRVFAETYEPTHIGPPATPNTVRRAVAAEAARRAALLEASGNNPPLNSLADRTLRSRSEGLVRPKEWSVAQQLKCGDGYVLPEIAPTVGITGKVARKQLGPQRSLESTRPW